MADFMVRFDDFKGGDWGERDPARADSDQFQAENLTLYGSGLLGVRAGLKPLTYTGLPDHPVVPGPMGFAAFNNTLLIVLNRIYQLPLPGGAATAWATYPTSAITPVRFVEGNGKMYSLLNGVLYRHDGTTGTVAITTPAPLSDITRWGYYMVGVDRNRPWRIWYNQVDSAGTNFDSWPANNYLDVGNNDAITSLKSIFNTLYVGKREGWWAVSGVLGTLASVRDVCIGNGPIDPRTTSVTTDNRIVYWPVEKIPAWFNGERVSLEEGQRMEPRNLPFTGDSVAVTPTAQRLVLAGDAGGDVTTIYTWKEQAWTHQRAVYRLGAVAPADVRAGYDLPEHVIYVAQRPTTVGDPARIAAYHHDLDRPAHTTDTYASPLDDVDLVQGWLRLPAYYDGQGRVCRVRSVIVQFRKWPSGVAYSMNRLSVRVEALGPYGAGVEMSDPVDWIEPSARAPSGGADDSLRANFGDQGFANGFVIGFPILAGVAIREVVAAVDVRTERT